MTNAVSKLIKHRSNVYLDIYVISFRFENTSLYEKTSMVYMHIGRPSDDSIPAVASIGRMIAHYRDRLSNSSSNSFMLDSSVVLWAGIHFSGEWFLRRPFFNHGHARGRKHVSFPLEINWNKMFEFSATTSVLCWFTFGEKIAQVIICHS